MPTSASEPGDSRGSGDTSDATSSDNPHPPVWVSVADLQDALDISEDDIVSLVTFVLAAEGATGGMEVALVTDEAMAEPHERYLGVPGPTAVMTFPMEADDDSAERLGAPGPDG